MKSTLLGINWVMFVSLLICFHSVSVAQTEYTMQIEPNNNPKNNLNILTEGLSFQSRYIVDSFFVIRSLEDHDESYFQAIAAENDFEVIYFDKTDRILDPVSNIHEKSCCDITIEMDDSYGDGWNGGYLTVDIDGVTNNYSASGYGSTVVISFCDGENIEISYTSGTWEGENSYIVSGPTGTLVSDGPNPTTGVVFTSTDICPEPTGQDCEGSQMVCSNNSFSGNSSGSGNFDDLNSSTDGCLSGENQTSWYYVNIGTSGTLAMDIVPQNGSDDYDFAIWGPFDETTANANCPPITSPIRCNWAQYPRTWSWGWCGTNTNPTGMQVNASLPTSTGACADQPYVRHLNVTAGDVYILVVDNYSGSSQPFDLNWGGSAGLDCTTVPLPVELISFEGQNQGVENVISWTTASEKNNDYFTLQHSTNGVDWTNIEDIPGAGTTSEMQFYSTTHRDFDADINYYRLIQVDYDGTITQHKTISIDNTDAKELIKRVNMLGQEVSKDYRGIVIEYYKDGTIRKYFNNPK